MQQAFQEVDRFTIEQYLEFNSQISSEMFISVMSILQERLPCSSFYFRQRRLFKQSLAVAEAERESAMQIDQYSASARTSLQNLSLDVPMRGGSHLSKLSARGGSTNGVDLAAYVTAIAEPRIINAWSPVKTGKHSFSRNTNQM